MQAMSLNFALSQKENTSFTTCKDQIESPHNRYACYISYQCYSIRFIEVCENNAYTTRRSTSLTIQ